MGLTAMAYIVIGWENHVPKPTKTQLRMEALAPIISVNWILPIVVYIWKWILPQLNLEVRHQT